MKKIFTILLTIVILLTACTPKDGGNKTSKPSQSATATATATEVTEGSEEPSATDEQLLVPSETSDDTQADTQASATANATEGAMTTDSPNSTANATSGTATGTKAPGATAAPSATSKPSSTGSTATATKKPSTTATAKPAATKKPTVKPTTAPTPTPQASKYYWSNAVTEYLTGDKNRFGWVGYSVHTVSDELPNLYGNVFGKCATGNYAGIWCGDGDTMYVESINKNGVISQAYKNRWYDSDVYEWVDEKRVTGVYLDMNYSKPGVEPNTEIDWWLTQYQELVTYNVFGVEVVVEQNKTNDMAVNFYPLETGDFVLDLGGVPVILNGIPETVLVRGGPTVNGLRDLQVSVNGHVVYEADWLGNICVF